MCRRGGLLSGSLSSTTASRREWSRGGTVRRGCWACQACSAPRRLTRHPEELACWTRTTTRLLAVADPMPAQGPPLDLESLVITRVFSDRPRGDGERRSIGAGSSSAGSASADTELGVASVQTSRTWSSSPSAWASIVVVSATRRRIVIGLSRAGATLKGSSSGCAGTSATVAWDDARPGGVPGFHAPGQTIGPPP